MNDPNRQASLVDPKPVGYLRAFDDDLGGALELVIRDLRSAGLSEEATVEMVWHEAERRFDHQFHDEPGGLTAVEVAELIQELVIEGHPPHTWPTCPHHPNHPLWLAGDFAHRAWTCPNTHEVVANLGDIDALTAARPGPVKHRRS